MKNNNDNNKNELSHSIGDSICVKSLGKNDMFWMEYGFSAVKFRVLSNLGGNGVLAHATSWLKRDSIIIKDGKKECYYAGRMSKLRGWFCF